MVHHSDLTEQKWGMGYGGGGLVRATKPGLPPKIESPRDFQVSAMPFELWVGFITRLIWTYIVFN